MNELFNTIKYIKDYVEGLEVGVNKFVDVIPFLVEQHVGQLAKTKLNTSYDNYMGALKSKVENNVLVVELDKDNWLANAVENGVGAFDLHTTLLNGPKAKTSKSGYKYLIVPIGKQKGGKGGSTDKSQELQKKINEVLLKPKLGISKLKTKLDGGVWETQEIITEDPQLSGFYRSRSFNSMTEYFEGRRKPTWNYVMFRIITNNPNSKAKWEHPGIAGNAFLPATERWLTDTAPQLLDSFIDQELKSRGVT